MGIYLDNAATTKVDTKIAEKVLTIITENYANPSALYDFAIQAENEITETEKIISSILNVKRNEIIFTSGGTESNAMAILGVANAYSRSGRNLITVKTEHSSVIENFRYLESLGYSVTYLDVDEKGYIDLNQLEDSINNETILVSIMFVNNETGIIQNISEIGKIIKSKNPKTKFHVDSVQAFGKLKINTQNIDLISISAHKIHAMKGAGALYIKSGTNIKPLFYGGEQQRALRSGTQNVAGIASLGLVAKEMHSNIEENAKNALNLKRKLSKVTTTLDDVFINGDLELGSHYILNLSFSGLKAEILLHALEAEKIYVSTGAACNSKSMKKQFQLPKERYESSIRFSFSKYNTESEIEICINALEKMVPQLRRVIKNRK